MEIRVDVQGVSCHGSAPERGDNAIYKMADIIQDIRALNENDAADTTEIKGLVKMLDKKYNPEWEEANFLGRGTVTCSQIFYTSPSRCAVADSCSISLDRRMTAGETWESCLDEIRALPSVKKYGNDVTVSLYDYARPSYTGLTYPIECYFPTWVIPKDHKVTTALEEAIQVSSAPAASVLPKRKPCEKPCPLRINGPSRPTAFPSWPQWHPGHRLWPRSRSTGPCTKRKDMETGLSHLRRRLRRLAIRLHQQINSIDHKRSYSDENFTGLYR